LHRITLGVKVTDGRLRDLVLTPVRRPTVTGAPTVDQVDPTAVIYRDVSVPAFTIASPRRGDDRRRAIAEFPQYPSYLVVGCEVGIRVGRLI
jgi:hypothetical protein